jgi:hypothetical protein
MPVFRRFGRPGLLGTVTQDAVVSGTENMTARAVDHTAGGAGPASISEQLDSLTRLNAAGSISDEEFIQAKRLLLGGN